MRRIITVLLCILLLLSLCGCGRRAGPGSQPEETSPQHFEEGVHPQLIAHAGGAIYGYRLTNSFEAIENAYSNGFRYIELDFERTSDGEIVLIHDWESMAKRMLFSEGVRTREQFQNSDSFADLTLIDIDTLLEWLAQHRDCRIVTDAKCGNTPFLRELYDRAGDLAQNFVPQVYSFDEYDEAVGVGFSDVILTMYLMDADESEVILFAAEKRPWAITIPEKYLTESLTEQISDAGVCCYTHTVNELSYFESWREHGLYGIYTDYFYPAKWPY